MNEELKVYLEAVLKVCSARAAVVIKHIIKHGYIDAQDLQDYGYMHGARAIGDVRDNGVPLTTERVIGSDGRKYARYVFGAAADIQRHKYGGRRAFPSRLKQQLLDHYGSTCALSGQDLPESELQIDHRVPYYIAGDNVDRELRDYMLLSRHMQRAKSWACENCENGRVILNADNCLTCYWASPDSYDHVSMKEERRFDLTFVQDEVGVYKALSEAARLSEKSPQEFIKGALRNYLERSNKVVD